MQVVIVGGGLSGLTTAYKLHQNGIHVTVLEARRRLGGRIQTVLPESRPTTPLDFGPAWVWDDQIHINKLMKRFHIKRFPQYKQGMSVYDNGARRAPHQFVPPPNMPAYRVDGGVQTIVDRLAAKIPDNQIYLKSEVTRITGDQDGLTVQSTRNGKTEFFDADSVVVALPPSLADTLITYDPTLPVDVRRAMQTTHTWMGQAMKIFLVYDSPFWRKSGLSGHGISHYDVVNELHDVSSDNLPFGVLFGFLGNNSVGRNMSPEEREEAIKEQVKRMYGWQARDYVYYGEINWSREHYTSGSYRAIKLSSGHPQYGDPLLQNPLMNGRLYLGGSEVSTVSGGYLDGAVYRGTEVADAILEKAKVDS